VRSERCYQDTVYERMQGYGGAWEELVHRHTTPRKTGERGPREPRGHAGVQLEKVRLMAFSNLD